MYNKITINNYINGDPLHENNLDEVLKLVKEIRISFPEKTIWLYTGYEMSEIVKQEQHEKVSGIPDVWSKRWEIIKQVNVLVEGKYIDEQKDLTLKWRGSKNQNCIDVKQSLAQNKIILYCD